MTALRAGPPPLVVVGCGGPAVAAALQDLQERFAADLWVAIAVDVARDVQVVAAAAGPYADRARVGDARAWTGSASRRAVLQPAPAHLDVDDGSGWGRPQLGVPLLDARGELVGALCAFADDAWQARWLQAPGAARLLAGLMIALLDGERAATTLHEHASAALALADHDELTGLLNRRGWQASVSLEQQRASRYGSITSVLVVDLDGLKQVNDRHGHRAGDRLLQRCGHVLTSTCRPGDVVSRLGGDEFGVLAVACDGRAAQALTTRLRTRLQAAAIAASAGCATGRRGEDLAAAWQRADTAMYLDKRRRARANRPVEPALVRS